MDERVKILFEYPGSTPGSIELESMWAMPTQNGFEIDNIPFYAREVSLGDVVSACADPGGMLRFERLVMPSEHSTQRLWFATDGEHQVPRIRQHLRDLGCPSELSDLPRLVAVDVPPTVPYESVRNILDPYARDGLLEYEESCLGAAARTMLRTQ